MLNAEDRIFIYVRLMGSDGEVARSKVRELAGLGTAMADLAGELIDREFEAHRFEYVEAGTHQPLISMYTDWGRHEHVIEGRIPERYQARMLDDPPRMMTLERFEERAGRNLDAAKRARLSARIQPPEHDILSLIREHIGDDGAFCIRLPLE